MPTQLTFTECLPWLVTCTDYRVIPQQIVTQVHNTHIQKYCVQILLLNGISRYFAFLLPLHFSFTGRIPAALWKQPPLVCLWNTIRSSSSWPRSLKVCLLMRWSSLKKLCWIKPAFLICFSMPYCQWTHNADLVSQRQSPALGSMQTPISWSISHTVHQQLFQSLLYCFFLHLAYIFPAASFPTQTLPEDSLHSFPWDHCFCTFSYHTWPQEIVWSNKALASCKKLRWPWGPYLQ